ncbi:MAG: hypothetical protein AMJ90_02040 [candidate division Zixibacteria bacterium SM23_73_2]|nr:MAG: hypothetical protein AMJ90_02040 [candidate division Zixibacteria bacterium SM23_73_2]
MSKAKKRRKNKRDKKSFGLVKFFLVLVFMGFLSLVYIWQKVTVLKFSQDIKEMKTEIAEKQKKVKYLNIEIAKLSSVERIERIAQLRLGLIYPKTDQIVFLEEQNFLNDKQKEQGFDLVGYFKKLADRFLDVPQNSLEAKEIDYDL